jgi:uncharacterized protein YqeY
MSQLRDQLKASLQSAIKSRDRIAIAALRSALSAIDNAEAVEGPRDYRPVLGVGAGEAQRRVLTVDAVREVLRTEIAERARAADEYERLGRPDEASRLRAEAAVLEHHL